MNIKKVEEEVKNYIYNIFNVCLFANELILYTEYLHRPDTDDELNVITNSIHSSFLQLTMHLYFRNSCLEISKLFNKSDHDIYNLNRLLKSLAPEEKYATIEFSPDKIILWQEKIKEKEDSINKIIKLRNKIYAHTDKSEIKFEVSIDELKGLVNLAILIITDIGRDILDAEYFFDGTSFDRKRFVVLKQLYEAEKKRKEESRARNINKMNAYK